MELDGIVLPITEPETEWVRGRALRKVSPGRDHARLQLVLAMALDRWSAGRGEVGTEWRFGIPVPGEARRPLVPDVAFVSRERLAPLDGEDLQVPPLAPDVAVEIFSPGDDPRDVASKVDAYLRAGAHLVVVADPAARTLVAHDRLRTATFRPGDVFRHPATAGLALDVGATFDEALERR